MQRVVIKFGQVRHLVNLVDPFVTCYSDQILASVWAPVMCDYQTVQFAAVGGSKTCHLLYKLFVPLPTTESCYNHDIFTCFHL